MSAPYCGETLVKIGEYYRDNILGYVSIPICCVGMITNLINIVVFARKPMTSPPNLIFAHLAFVDLLVLLARVPFIWTWYIQDYRVIGRSYVWTLFQRYNDEVIVTFQFVSIFLTVMLAVWRYIAIVHPLKERHWCNTKRTRNVVIAGYILCFVLFTVPSYMSREIKTVIYQDAPYHYIDINERSPIQDSIVLFINGIVIRLVPSIMLTVLTLRLVCTLLSRKPHREQLTSSASVRSDMKNVKMRQQTNKSTTILLIVVALFILAEFPKGMLSLMRSVYEYESPQCFSLTEIFYTVSDINSTITLLVYYSLSQQFRTTFKSLFHRKHTPVTLGDVEDDETATKTDEV
ncbi:sex peptide receptor-like [Planococcus citri]|uniref:sex peptide receptor-like n=1 Tax=Planococcus citri TaxID=170843 RepID=UPI0031F80B48